MKSKNDSKPIKRERLEDLVLAAENGSYTNSDGTGAFGENGRIFRTARPLHDLDYQEVVNRLYGHSEVVLHIRASTRGAVKRENSHPFQQDRQVLAHNGTLHGLHGEEGVVDSEQFLNRIVEKDVQDPVKRVKEALSDTRGWLSIFYRDLSTGDTLYFRNRASFTFGTTDSEYVGATRSTRLDEMGEYGGYTVRNRVEPEEGKIYRVGTDSDVLFRSKTRILDPVEDFELDSISRSTYYSRPRSSSGGIYRLVSTREKRQKQGDSDTCSGVVYSEEDEKQGQNREDDRTWYENVDSYEEYKRVKNFREELPGEWR